MAARALECPLGIGMVVEFELGLGLDGRMDGRPRWNHERDRGATGQWCRGMISGQTPGGDWLVDFHNPVTGWSECWSFSTRGGRDKRPGWLRAPGAEAPTCECGAARVWGRGPHSDWCPMR